MPKPILSKEKVNMQQLDINKKEMTNKAINPLILEKKLREKRSSAYMEAIKQLDIAGFHMDQSKFKEFIDTVNNEFKDIGFNNQLLGIVAKCYLGQPYEVHSLDMLGNIVVHYKINEDMPGLLNRARSLALHGGYELIEVYTDCLRAVKIDGSITVAK